MSNYHKMYHRMNCMLLNQIGLINANLLLNCLIPPPPYRETLAQALSQLYKIHQVPCLYTEWQDGEMKRPLMHVHTNDCT